MTPPRAILWDWDGTLVDSQGFLRAAHNHVRAGFGLEPINTGAFERYFGAPRAVLYTELYGAERTEQALAAFEAYVRARHLEVLAPFPGAGGVLEVATRLGVPMGVVSNKRRQFLALEAQHFGWDGHFGVIVGAGEAEADKPSAAPLLLALQWLGQDPGPDVWLVGDTDNDVVCAVSAGCTAVFIGDNDPGAGKVFADLAELRAFLIAMGPAPGDVQA